MKILLVDDSKTMRNIQRGILVQLGYIDIDEAGDGAEAMAMVPTTQPDLLLVDWNMPNVDGLSFVKQYRAAGGTAPIIMVTTEAEKTNIVEAIKAGVTNYVVKPFTPDVLAERIRETLARAQAA